MADSPEVAVRGQHLLHAPRDLVRDELKGARLFGRPSHRRKVNFGPSSEDREARQDGARDLGVADRNRMATNGGLENKESRLSIWSHASQGPDTFLVCRFLRFQLLARILQRVVVDELVALR